MDAKPTNRGSELEKERIKSLVELEKLGINPFEYKYERSSSMSVIREKYEKLDETNLPKTKFSVAGRLMKFRRMGKMAFADLEDEMSHIQLIFKKDLLKDYTLLKHLNISTIM